MLLGFPSARRSLLQIETGACLACQWRTFAASYRRLDSDLKTTKTTLSNPNKHEPTALPPIDAPRASGKAVDKFSPKPLGRPIGLPKPPRQGENSGIDKRTWKEKRDDFTNYDKHLVKRQQLTHKMSTPYFREWSNMQWSKGKSFLAPPHLFKADRALYFPNLHGQTLEKDKKGLSDTTPVLENKVSVVSLFSSAWAENQASTFVSEKHNPSLHQVLNDYKSAAQIVHINIEENPLKAWLIKFFMPSLRKTVGTANLGKYFLVKRGINDDIRDAIGLLNSKVGYTYLVDGNCKIRWAGSGPAEESEKEALAKGLSRLLTELN